jgi:hypothetical protein
LSSIKPEKTVAGAQACQCFEAPQFIGVLCCRPFCGQRITPERHVKRNGNKNV